MFTFRLMGNGLQLQLAGGPFYPVHTGRKDSDYSFPEISYECISLFILAFLASVY
uniref:Uncharacterized protein n=1 Tax=Helianthus annuus TaxID=4232 RepID=A0A251SSU5_HELAN